MKREHRLRVALLRWTAVCLSALALFAAAPSASAEEDPRIDRNAEIWFAYNEEEGIEHRCAEHSDYFRFRFYYRSNYGGAFINIGQPIWDLKSVSNTSYSAPLLFCGGPSDGRGQEVANNAASAYNWYIGYCATSYYYKGYQGASSGYADTLSPRTGRNLGVTANNNRSVNFASCRLS
ncbi:hypothetical protein [Streptomyces sp. VRA16 Mangrove soil]|uniref:hypothetical protein n=1 Tax=Streptomyces sp. VRA16 Mangrove soil TaxID=2817434 RepID=UPI001A9F3A18|nr:hypothetical protein [Streptomyces sp. VRA16 Mangrove soil]MBO1331374.1 hypothetical protein [Streptomyces sp. VRA16 Mangrove soil]